MKYVWVLLVIGLSAGLTALGQKPPEYYLTGNFKEAPGIVATDKGDQQTNFFGSIGFRVVPTEKGLLIYLFNFNLISRGVPTQKGDTGLLSLRLLEALEKPMTYDPRSGRASGEFQMVLHYELIDRAKGFRSVETKGETDLFASFTEEMKGKMIARFPDRPMQVLQAYYVSDEMIRALVQQLAGGSSGEWRLDDLEADLVEYAVQELGGNFIVNRLYEAFKGEISKRRLEEMARTWERRGWLTPPRDAVSPRRVTPTLLRLAGLAPGRENDDTMTGVTGGDRAAW